MRKHIPIRTHIGLWLFVLLLLPMLTMAHNEQDIFSGYTVRRYTDENGLPQNSIKAVVPDIYGFIWLATESGVVRFDGKDFRTYGKAEMGLESARMLGFVPGSREGELYALTDREELVSVYRGKVSKGGILSKTYRSLYTRYLHSPGNDPQFGYPAYHWHPINKGYYKIYLSDSRSYYACSATRIRYYRSEWQVFDFPCRQDSLSEFFLLDGHLYLHDGNNGFQTPVSKGMFRFSLPLPADSSREHRTHIIWNAITGKAYLYRNLGLYELLRRPDGSLRAELLLSGFALDRHNIHSVHRDPTTGTLFLGSSTEGLYLFEKHRFSTLRTGLGADYEVFYAHDYYKNNSVITTQGYILGPDMAPRSINISSNEVGGWRYTLVISRRGRPGIWFVDSDRHGLVELNMRLEEQRRYPLPRGEDVHVLYEGLDGAIWLSLTSGLYRLNPNDSGAHFAKISPIVASYINQPDAGSLWIGRHNGLSRLSLVDSQWVDLHDFDGMTVRNIYTSNNASETWITTYGDGFFLIKEGRVVRFPMDRKSYLAYSHCILEDRNGFFWITTNKGLFQMAKSDLLAYAAGQAPGVYYYYYGKESGFNTNEFNGGCQPCAARWEDGSFSFPSLDGLVHFNPYEVKPEFPDKEIFFDHIELDGKPIEPADTLTFSPDFNRVTFYITTPYYGPVNNLQLQASLQKSYGENLWTTLDGDNAISFTTLQPGTYRLLIRKSKGFGVGNYSYRTVVLIVPPAFWQTGWFMALAGLLLVLGVYAVIRSRIRYVQHRNRELERIITERTQDLRETIKALRQSKKTLARQSQLQQKMILAFSHDLKSPLMYLMITGQKMYESLRSTPGKLLDSIQIMYHSSFNMFHFTDNFLNYAKVYFLNERPGRERFSVHGLAHEKIEIFRYIAESKNIELRNRIPHDMHLHMNRMLLSIIFHNLLDNAIKYTDEGHIDFSVTIQGNTATIYITDTGMGMDNDVKKQYADIFGLKLNEEYINEGASKGLGLQIVAELMHILGGRLHVQSQPEKGTVIALQFKNSVEE